ncbi:polysaccharide deacetylase family sporulation protein PdaB [Sporomusa acidovorans]|uniref:NodB homology domain-containing protein n=1 Tax=Sporomusa acidovorans (strain ATCC 49682 / DSM 3132 / Mol) TaxID=1123286 RepID=A0ABZ3IZB8_SPOA4|nr:polysaccharide deacetylase family sporulation protein PdaB [Sporomusa acidovorans]OZC19181.1 peptidoglycan-N-acetylmuramic acid deacetylase PdaA precursor [Sporomusa acidovorans DSM 3132]SDF11527.1 polysaccharide deacetylase family sporulation protein PdaB [Sporomusa acidovorans]
MVISLRRLLHHRNIFYSIFGLLAISVMYMQVADVISGGPIAIAGTRTDQKVVALTFDHSWGNKFTPSILDTLQKNNIHSTFFIMGPWATKFPEVAKRIAQDGHEVASHGYRHENYGDMSPEWVKEDIMKAHEQIKEVTGVEPRLLRPPNGHYSQTSLKVTDELGYKTIIWNVDSLDWKNPGRDVIVARVMKRLKPGAIILMHASDTPVQTADALPILIDKIKAEGYSFVTVGELLEKYSDKGIQRH